MLSLYFIYVLIPVVNLSDPIIFNKFSIFLNTFKKLYIMVIILNFTAQN